MELAVSRGSAVPAAADAVSLLSCFVLVLSYYDTTTGQTTPSHRLTRSLTDKQTSHLLLFHDGHHSSQRARHSVACSTAPFTSAATVVLSPLFVPLTSSRTLSLTATRNGQPTATHPSLLVGEFEARVSQQTPHRCLVAAIPSRQPSRARPSNNSRRSSLQSAASNLET